MNILVINSGSSSLKYQLIDMDTEKVLCKGLCERIGIEGSRLTHEAKGEKFVSEDAMPSHAEAFQGMLKMMTEGEGAVVKSKDEIHAIGHRVVHGGEKFKKSELVTEEMVKTVEELSVLAPLHNPPQVLGIRSAQRVFGENVPQVAVFDTAFHQTMPAKAYMYAVPYEYYEEHGVRRYGFHGTSHRFVSMKAAEYLGKKPEELKIITCHLGNGSSITAVDGGNSVDTSMGLTPLGGLMMGTRAGDLDPGVAINICEFTGANSDELSAILNQRSGLLGVSGISSDNRDLEAASDAGNERAILAQDMLSYQIRKYIGSYTAVMNGLDVLVFTGGIGENSSQIRGNVCNDLDYLGVAIDAEENKKRGEAVIDITAEGAKVKTLVIKTNEELMIAQDTLAILNAQKA